MKIRIFIIVLIFISCEDLSRTKYPQKITAMSGYLSIISSCFEKNIENEKEMPIRLQKFVKKYFQDRLEESDLVKLKFDFGYIHSNIKFKKEKKEITIDELFKKTDCDTTYNYPVYNLIYSLDLKNKGIDDFILNLVVDNNENVVSEIEYPLKPFNTDEIIQLDSVVKVLIERRISPKKLEIGFWYNRTTKSYYWDTKKLIRQGSIGGPSCFSEYKFYFTMDATNGKIIEK